MRRTFATAAAAAALVLFAKEAAAHHAFAAEYDVNRVVTVSGAVTRIDWVNPHAWLYVESKNASGAIVNWKFEMGSPGGLKRRGWQRADLKEHDQVTVTGYGAKDGSNIANVRTVTLADGRKLFGGFQSTPGAPPRRP